MGSRASAGRGGFRRAAAATLATLAAGGAAAQGVPRAATTLPDPGRALREAGRLAEPAPAPLEPGAEAEVRFTSQTPPANAADIRFTLRDIELAGGTVYPEAELRALYASRLGAEQDLASVFAVAAAIQARYRDDGYLFTRVLVPAQRIEDGRVRLEIVEAVIASVTLEEPGAPIGPVRGLAERMVRPLEGLRNPTLDQIERVLLLLNDVPGITRAAAVPKLGDETRGAIDLHVNVERDALGTTVFADNRQSPILGSGLVGAVGSVNSWSPYGDSTTISYFNSADIHAWVPGSFGERWTVQAEHRHFLGASGLSVEGRALYSESRPGGSVEDFDIEADQTEMELALRWPAMRTRGLRFDVVGGAEAVQVNSLAPGVAGGADLKVDDRLHVIFAGIEGLRRDGWGAFEGALELRRGLDLFDASAAGDAELSRDDGDGEFWLVRAELARTVALPMGFGIWTKAWGQAADRPLLASEEFSVGGAELGRAYHPSEVSGDLGAGVAAELRWGDTFGWRGWQAPVEIYGFADAAEVRNLDGGQPVHAALISAGAGLRAQLPGRFAVNLEAARPINQPLSYDQSDNWRVLFSAVKEF